MLFDPSVMGRPWWLLFVGFGVIDQFDAQRSIYQRMLISDPFLSLSHPLQYRMNVVAIEPLTSGGFVSILP